MTQKRSGNHSEIDVVHAEKNESYSASDPGVPSSVASGVGCPSGVVVTDVVGGVMVWCWCVFVVLDVAMVRSSSIGFDFSFA